MQDDYFLGSIELKNDRSIQTKKWRNLKFYLIAPFLFDNYNLLSADNIYWSEP